MQVWLQNGSITPNADKVAKEANIKITELLLELVDKGISIRDAELMLHHEIFIASTVLVTTKKV